MLNSTRDLSTKYECLKNLLMRKKGRGHYELKEERKSTE